MTPYSGPAADAFTDAVVTANRDAVLDQFRQTWCGLDGDAVDWQLFERGVELLLAQRDRGETGDAWARQAVTERGRHRYPAPDPFYDYNRGYA